MSKTITIFGLHGIESLLQNNPEFVLKVLIQNGRKDKKIIALTKILSSNKIPFLLADKDKMDKISKGEAHQGIISDVILRPLLNEDSLLASISSVFIYVSEFSIN